MLEVNIQMVGSIVAGLLIYNLILKPIAKGMFASAVKKEVAKHEGRIFLKK